MANKYSCIKQQNKNESGAAALATLMHHYGLEITYNNMKSLLGIDSLEMDMLFLLAVSNELGFESVPLEGSFDELPEVVRPNIIVFNDESNPELQHFNVLFEIDKNSATIGDTKTGEVKILSKEEFVKNWNGDAIQIQPNDTGFETFKKKLIEFNNPFNRFKNNFGITKPYFPKIIFLISVLAILTLTILSFNDTTLTNLNSKSLIFKFMFFSNSMCLIFALFSVLNSNSCMSCTKANILSGSLPVAKIGALFYAVSFIILVFINESLLYSFSILLATGAHLFLILKLLVKRLLCIPCVLTAFFAFIASGLSIYIYSPSPIILIFLIASGFTSAYYLVGKFYEQFIYETNFQIQKLGQTIFSQNSNSNKEQTELIVYLKDKCSACAYYKSIFKPSIKQDFGNSVILNENFTNDNIPAAPLYFIKGACNFMFIGNPENNDYKQLKMALEISLNSGLKDINNFGGYYLIGNHLDINAK